MISMLQRKILCSFTLSVITVFDSLAETIRYVGTASHVQRIPLLFPFNAKNEPW